MRKGGHHELDLRPETQEEFRSDLPTLAKNARVGHPHWLLVQMVKEGGRPGLFGESEQDFLKGFAFE